MYHYLRAKVKKMFNISVNKPRSRMRIHTYGYDLKETINILNKFPYSDKNFCYKCMRNEHILFKQVS